MMNILIGIAAAAVLLVGGGLMYRHFVIDRIMDGDGMENPDAVSGPAQAQKTSETAELLSLHWSQNAMSYADCFTFGVFTAGQDISDPRLYCDYTDIDTYERIKVGDDYDVETCPPISLEYWAELSEFLGDAKLSAYREPYPNLPDATNSIIQVTWCENGEQFTSTYDGASAHDLLVLLQGIARETYCRAEEKPKS